MRRILLAALLLPLPIFAQAQDFSVVVGKTCRGYYNRAEGGTGQLERPESAFKTTSVSKDGAFTLLAAKPVPGASKGWDTNNGNTYWNQGDAKFNVQPDGSWLFHNTVGGSRYYLTLVGPTPQGVAFTIRYEHEKGTAVGKALCTDK